MRVPIQQLNAVIPPGVAARYYLRRVRCSKEYCHVCPSLGGHGPYWYASWRTAQGKRQQFLGRDRPTEISAHAAELAIQRYVKRQQAQGWPTDVPDATAIRDP